jgi:hypothetical protein
VRSVTRDTTSTYHRIPEADLKPQLAADFTGSFYSMDVDASWQFTSDQDRLILHRRGFAEEKLDFAFRDAFLGDLGLFHFIRDSLNRVTNLTVMNYRLGKVDFIRQIEASSLHTARRQLETQDGRSN